MFGICMKGEKESMGEYGSRKYVYAIQLDKFNSYRRLTEEELRIFKGILVSVYGS